MKGVVCICGKGGVGKTTISALLSRLVLERQGIRGLAVDADPGGGLSMALSLPVKKTVNDLRKTVIEAVKTRSSDRMNVAASIDFQLLESLSEHRNLAFLAVGRPEEEGCYCQVNSFLRESIQILAGQFDFTVIDAEAGVEQVNRRVIEQIDLLLLVSDQSAKGISVAETIAEVAAKTMRGHRTGLLLNRLQSLAEAEYIRRNTALDLLGWLPEDRLIREFDLSGRSFLGLTGTSPSLVAIRELAGSLLG